MSFLPTRLDVDESVLERRLRLISNEDSDQNDFKNGLDKISGLDNQKPPLSSTNPRLLLPDELNLPSVEATPEPGLCVKTRNKKGGKVFINLCKLQQIPPPDNISEEELQTIIADEDYQTDFSVPMSLGAPREEKDKSGDICLACDVAINNFWFESVVVKSQLFTAFVVNVSMEGLCDKYGEQCNLDRQNWVMLKNKKYLGSKVQKHRIQKRARGNKIAVIGEDQEENLDFDISKKTTVEEPPKRLESEKQVDDGLMIRAASTRYFKKTEKTDVLTPELKLFQSPPTSLKPVLLTAYISLPLVEDKSEIELDLGEDRMVLRAPKYELDVYLPFNVSQDGVGAHFDSNRKALIVKMAIK